MKLAELVKIIEHAIPPEWALPNDPIGLQIGDPNQDVKNVLVGLEISTEFLHIANEKEAQLLFVHHPLLFNPLKKVLQSHPVQRLVREMIKHDLALYAAHTNLDLHPEGMGKVWAKRLGCTNIEPLSSKPQCDQLKLVTFVPPEYTDQIRATLSNAGAGIIGEYDQCSYTLRGTGTFRGSEHSDPFAGKAGQFETVNEERLEMIVPRSKKHAVIRALFTAHPYDEPAYDLYLMEDVRDLSQAVWIGEFDRNLPWDEFMTKLKNSLPTSPEIGGVTPNPNQPVKRIALSTGSGNSVLPIIFGLGVDVYLTGELGYHHLWEAKERGQNTITVGHDHSENLFAETVIPLVSKYTQDIHWIHYR